MSDEQATPRAAVRGRCIHSTATLGPRARPSCDAGVVYADLVGREPGWAGRLPCSRLRQHETRPPVPCALRQEPTDAEVAAWREHIDGAAAGALQSNRLIQAQHKETGAFEGVVECPTCRGKLRWSMARSNKHVAAACETKGCIAWMQ